MSEKITISWDEAHSEKVDEKLKQLDMLERTGAHQQHVRDSSNIPADSSSFFYISWVYLGIFGIVAGLISWAVSETFFHVLEQREKQFAEFVDYYNEETVLKQDLRDRLITQEEFDQQLSELKEGIASNMCAAKFENMEGDDNSRLEMLQWQCEGLSLCVVFSFSTFSCMMIGIALSSADNIIDRNWNRAINQGGLAALIGSIGGMFCVIGACCVFGSLSPKENQNSSIFLAMLARSLAWGVIGMFVAIAPGIVLQSSKKAFLGLAGGLIGGLLGGLLFDPIAVLTNNAVISRLVGVLAFSTLAGLAMGLLEEAAKEGWLKVSAGIIAGKQFILYRNPTYIGSSPKCEIYLFKDPAIMPQHAAVLQQRGTYTIEPFEADCELYVNGNRIAQSQKLEHGDRIAIGSTVFTFGLKQK